LEPHNVNPRAVDQDLAPSSQSTAAAPSPSRSPLQRLLSLDVVRGITICFMIMVNNNGGAGAWHFMNHAQWNGLTPTDLVFPTFVFVVGVSIVFGFQSRLRKGATRAQLAIHTLQRAVILILLGIVVNSFPFFELRHMRFFGVLQRIAVCYLVVGLFYLWDRRATTKIAALAVCLLGYWAMLWFIPIPGTGTPGKDLPFMDPTRNIVSYVDRQLMPGHLYLDGGTGPNSHSTRDPEGLLSDISAIGTCLLGLLTGLWLRSPRSNRQKFGGLAMGAAACLAIGYLWSLTFPLNKNMWTSSYVLVAGGYSLCLMALCFWAIELRNWRTGWTWPWIVFGSNAIAAYMFSELVPSAFWLTRIQDGARKISLQDWLMRHFFTQIAPAGWAQFLWAVCFAALCLLPAWLLYRKRIFIKI
jgi:predicted acyltransferase